MRFPRAGATLHSRARCLEEKPQGLIDSQPSPQNGQSLTVNSKPLTLGFRSRRGNLVSASSVRNRVQGKITFCGSSRFSGRCGSLTADRVCLSAPSTRRASTRAGGAPRQQAWGRNLKSAAASDSDTATFCPQGDQPGADLANRKPLTTSSCVVAARRDDTL